MGLPLELRAAIALALEGISRTALSERAARMSALYRGGATSGHALREELDALAYAVTRMPATYAAGRHVLGRLHERNSSFAPRSVLDLGAGPGTASWAAADAWPALERITQVDAHPALLQVGDKFAQAAPSAALRDATRRAQDLTRGVENHPAADLVMLSYTLAEMTAEQIAMLIGFAWRASAGTLAIVEPGTPHGHRRILQARELLLGFGAKILAPCPHPFPCPLRTPDWCHYAQRVPRSRDHRLVKSSHACL